MFDAWDHDATQASGTALGGYRWEDNLLDVINWAKDQLLDLSRLADAVVAREVLSAGASRPSKAPVSPAASPRGSPGDPVW